MSERTPVPADVSFRCAIQMICTARRIRVEARSYEQRSRATLETVADMQSRDAMALVMRATG